MSAKEIGSIVLGCPVDWQDGAWVARMVIFIHVSFLTRCIMKMGPLLQLYANRGHILSGKFTITMTWHIFEKQASNHSSNDAHDWSIDRSRSQTRLFNNLTVYHCHIIMKARITIKRSKNKRFFNLTRTWLMTRTWLGLELDSCYE